MKKLLIETPDTVDVDIRGKALNVDIGRFPIISLSAIFLYGVQQIIADAAGRAGPKPGTPTWKKENPGKESTESDMREWLESAYACSQAKLSALYDGDTRVQGSGRRADPVAHEMSLMAYTILKKNGKLPKDNKAATAAIREFIAANAGKLREKAEAIVKAREANIDDLDF